MKIPGYICGIIIIDEIMARGGPEDKNDPRKQQGRRQPNWTGPLIQARDSRPCRIVGIGLRWLHGIRANADPIRNRNAMKDFPNATMDAAETLGRARRPGARIRATMNIKQRPRKPRRTIFPFET